MALGGVIWRLMVVRGGSLGELARCCSVAASGPPDVTGNVAGDAKAFMYAHQLQRLLQRIFSLVADVHLLACTEIHQMSDNGMPRPLNLDR